MTAFSKALADSAAAAEMPVVSVFNCIGVEAGAGAWNGLLPEDAMRMLPALGIGHPLGEEFPCVLPGARPDQNAYVDPVCLRYQALYHGQHSRKEGWWSLAEVHASQCAGRRVVIRKVYGEASDVAHAAWWLRLRRAAGLIVPPDLVLPRLSPDARRLADGFALVFAANEGADSPFSRRFASALCDVPDTRTHKGIHELRVKRVLLPAGALNGPRPQGWRPTPLYTLASECIAGSVRVVKPETEVADFGGVRAAELCVRVVRPDVAVRDCGAPVRGARGGEGPAIGKGDASEGSSHALEDTPRSYAGQAFDGPRRGGRTTTLRGPK